MKAKIFSFVKVSDESMIASVRIARFVANTLDLDVCWDKSIADEPLDILIIVNGAFAFSGADLLEALGQAIVTANRVIWIQNDYTIIPPKDKSGAESPFRKAFRTRYDKKMLAIDYWTTCEAMASPGLAMSGHHIGDDSHYINWNCLTFSERPIIKMADRQFPYAMIYYGSYRKDRIKAFDRYFSDPHILTMISSPSRKFEASFDSANVHHLKKFPELAEVLCEFGLGLYIEDRRSHKEFHSPANRFYEMLSAGVPMVFQPEAITMMAQAGYAVRDFTARTPDEVSQSLDKAEEMHEEQHGRWYTQAMAERHALTGRLMSAWEGMR
jgi:hypothetical protein